MDLAARFDPAAVDREIRRVLAVLDDAGALRPRTLVGNFKGPFEVGKLADKLVRGLDTPEGRVVGSSVTMRSDELEYNVSIGCGACDLTLDASYLLSRFTSGDTSQTLIALTAKLASQLGALFSRSHSATDLQLVEPPYEQREYRLAPDQVEEIYWLNVWGPEIVERIGRPLVLATPAWHVEELSYGGVLVVIRPTPLDYASAEARDAQARVLAHVRPDLDEAAIRATLAERSRKLAPVEHAFDRDVAELLELLVEREMRSERPTEAARLNSFHPPAVTEFRTEPLPAQGELAVAIERYGDNAEQLVALLRKDIPEIEGSDPAVLPRIDDHLWHFNFAEDYDRADVESDLVPAVGAYLGQMMVDRLGGSWVPRTKLDEAQVVIGGTAYLPFLRARHALSSRQAQLDHSLTQFFRVAARAATSQA